VTTRDDRQATIATWTTEAFGQEQAISLQQRALRMLEEAVELYQACGAPADMAHRLFDYVFSRPVGDVAQEVGGLSVTVLALSAAAGISAEAEEVREVERVLSKGAAHFAARNQVKCDAGLYLAAAGPTLDALRAAAPEVAREPHEVTIAKKIQRYENAAMRAGLPARTGRDYLEWSERTNPPGNAYHVAPDGDFALIAKELWRDGQRDTDSVAMLCHFCGAPNPTRAIMLTAPHGVLVTHVCADPAPRADKPTPTPCAWKLCARWTNGAHKPGPDGACLDCGKPAIVGKAS
jgi:hypothetical protein